MFFSNLTVKKAIKPIIPIIKKYVYVGNLSINRPLNKVPNGIVSSVKMVLTEPNLPRISVGIIFKTKASIGVLHRTSIKEKKRTYER